MGASNMFWVSSFKFTLTNDFTKREIEGRLSLSIEGHVVRNQGDMVSNNKGNYFRKLRKTG